MTDMQRVRVLVVDDHPIVRDGLRSVLQAKHEIKLVNVCATGEEALKELSRHNIDVLLADLRMTPMSGLELLKHVKVMRPDVAVLVFSSYEREEEIYQAYIAGAAGYLSKNASSDELVHAIVAAVSGEKVFSKNDVMMCEERQRRKGVTDRELQILEMLAKGLTNKEIGEALCISHFTVRNLIKRLYSKLDATDRTEATRIAIERGIIVVD